MKKKEANQIIQFLKEVRSLNNSQYKVEDKVFDHHLVDFHQWADFKKHLGSFLIRDLENDAALWFVFVEWNKNYGFYMVVFPENKKGPLIEIHKIINKQLEWRYKPSKRDGRNLERKEYFETFFGTIEANISVPENEDEVFDFIEDVFQLTENRVKADDLSEVIPSERKVFPEGRRVERIHFARERNLRLISAVKKKFKIKYGKLFCEVCGFDFETTYGHRGKDFIEAHHTKPLSELDTNGEETNPAEVALVCSNCHKMIHRIRPWLNIDELKKILQ